MSSTSKNIRRRYRPIAWLRRHVSRARERCLAYFSVGRWGERVAARYLARRGIITLQTNWRASRLEADIIATDGRHILVVEVKTRHHSLEPTFPGIDSVTGEKLQHLFTLAERWIRNNGALCRRFSLRSFQIGIAEVYYRPIFGPFRVTTDVRWHENARA